jgi:hypothetical protein
VSPRLWRITLIVEADDEAEVERLAEVVGGPLMWTARQATHRCCSARQ